MPHKIKFLTVSAIAVLSVFFAAGPEATGNLTPEQAVSEAMNFAGNQDFDSALQLLALQSAETQSTYDVRFTRARILSWDKQYDEAAREFDRLMLDYPGNPDIQNAYGYLEYYRGNYDRADNLFNKVLAAYPGYEDARTGLKRTQDARDEFRRNNHRWRLDVNGGTSSFDNGQADWNYQSARAERQLDDVAVHGGVTRYERFGMTDVELIGGVRSNTDSAWDWQLEAGFTPSSDFRPETGAKARLGRTIETAGDTVIHASLGYHIDDYKTTGTVQQLTPQLTAYLDNDIVLNGRLIHVMQDGISDTGWMVSGSAPVADRLSLRAGYANAPETVNGITIDTESIFGGVTYSVTNSLDLHATYTLDDRENTYKRDALNVGITQKY